jgi:flavin reductase (DIM6/NTAB) family NADH-FMN oxidoreductase RutF
MLKPLEKKALNPSTMLAPVPVVLVSCRGTRDGDEEKPNLITLAWAGTVCSEPPMVSISIRKSRFSHQKIIESGEFVINLVNDELLKATDFCGVKSGRDLDKFAVCKLTPVPAAGLSITPAVAESPLTLSCKVRQVIELGSHDCFIAEIIAVEAAAKLIDKQDKLHLDRANLIAYVHGEYRMLGDLAGFFGYSVASPQVLARRLPKKVTPNQSLRRPVKRTNPGKPK